MLNYLLVKSLTDNDSLETQNCLTRGLDSFVYDSYAELFEAILGELIVTYDEINNSEMRDLVLTETVFNLLIFMVFVFSHQEENQILSGHEEFTYATLNFLNLNAHYFVYKYSWVCLTF